ncbi:MAG: Ger(x)C family spore germination protein [Clostridiales bacterium]|jgi:spore germination protein KC|nr:Ger(x)C family spore germination protein [Clostridiales bacterium]MCI1962415.1 Ger(x)C family spore germination protein [Clostridiales bacterium]MCI2022683.1 Ger(x)C family spore germination protein [Clostridiales bacterium]MCI2027002.1 Ger(x)C family spore germination protein [Clostridiales bacterium]
MKKGKCFSLVAVALSVCLLFSGCMDSKELTDIIPVVGVGIDNAGDDLTKLTLQLGHVGSASEKDKAKTETLIYEKTGRNLFNMFRDCARESSHKLFIGHNQCLIFGKEAASKGIKSQLDLFLRDHEGRIDVSILVSDSTANEILTTKSEMSPMSALDIIQLLKNQQATSESTDVDLLEFLTKLERKTTCPVTSLIKVDKQSDPPRLELSGLAVFKNDKMVGELDKDKSRGYLWTMNKVESGTVDVETESGRASLEICSSSSSLNPSVQEDGTISVPITVKTELGVRELAGFENADATSIEKELQEAAIERIKGRVLSCFQATQVYQADIYGIGTLISQTQPNKWKEIQENWDQLYSQIKPEIKAEVTIKDSGKILRS